jgi:hypothetical protein
MLVQASKRPSSFGNPSRVTVRISSMPSRFEPAELLRDYLADQHAFVKPAASSVGTSSRADLQTTARDRDRKERDFPARFHDC